MLLTSNNLPPELIDGIIYLLTAAVGWFARWLKDRQKVKELKKDLSHVTTGNKIYSAENGLLGETVSQLEDERAKLVNEVRLMNDRFNELGEFAKNQSETIVKLRKNANEKL